MGLHVFDLRGKRAVVTGAATGIGQAIAEGLASAGADVASIYLATDGPDESVARVEALGRQAMFVEGDVSDPEQVETFTSRVENEWGGVDIWVNNASRLLVKYLPDATDAELRSLFDTNLHGYLHGCRAAAARMKPQGSGRIINLSSITASQPTSAMVGYVAAKGAVTAISKALAVELAGDGITVNSIAPGAIETPMSSDAYSPSVRAAYESRIPVNRVGVAEDVTGAAVFLASDEASYVTGTEIVVDGGLTINGNIIHPD